MRTLKMMVVLAAAAGWAASSAEELQPGEWKVRLGGGGTQLRLGEQGAAHSATNMLGGMRSGMLGEAGYRVSNNWSMGVSLSMAGQSQAQEAWTYGKWNTETQRWTGAYGNGVGIAALQTQYSLVEWGAQRPYVGLGAMYMVNLAARDKTGTRWLGDGSWAGTVKAGMDYRITGGLGMFIDYRLVVVRSFKLNDWTESAALQTGVNYRF